MKSDRGPIEVYLCPEDDDVYNSDDIKSEPMNNDHQPLVAVKTEAKGMFSLIYYSSIGSLSSNVYVLMSSLHFLIPPLSHSLSSLF